MILPRKSTDLRAFFVIPLITNQWHTDKAEIRHDAKK